MPNLLELDGAVRSALRGLWEYGESMSFKVNCTKCGLEVAEMFWDMAFPPNLPSETRTDHDHIVLYGVAASKKASDVLTFCRPCFDAMAGGQFTEQVFTERKNS